MKSLVLIFSVFILAGVLFSAVAAQDGEQFLSEAAKEKFNLTQADALNETKNITIEAPELPEPGVVPTSAFYQLDLLAEHIQVALTKNTEAKTNLHLKFAEERLAETKVMLERNKDELAQKGLDAYESEVGIAQELAKDDEALQQHIIEVTSKHIEVLQRILEQVPEQAKPAIEHALNVSVIGHENAVQRLEEIQAEKAAEESAENKENETEMEQYLSEAAKEKLRESNKSEEAAQGNETAEDLVGANETAGNQTESQEEPEPQIEINKSQGKGWH